MEQRQLHMTGFYRLKVAEDSAHVVLIILDSEINLWNNNWV